LTWTISERSGASCTFCFCASSSTFSRCASSSSGATSMTLPSRRMPKPLVRRMMSSAWSQGTSLRRIAI
jgi:hypothetical protein